MISKKQYRRLLEEFTQIFGKDRFLGFSYEFKIGLLIEWAELKKEKRKLLAEMRDQFEHQPKISRAKLSNRTCKACLGRAQVRHHIVQLQHGGTNDVRNIVPLCRDCHKKIHPWLS
jgi:5-methylcytosine-specific restriction endonuclease McrA